MLAMDQAMRGSTTKFVRQNIGDVLVGWENEILQVIDEEKGSGKYEIVVPSETITIDVPVALVDKVVDKHGVREVAEAYVKWLWSKPGQEIIARRFNRPRDPEIAKQFEKQFPQVKQFTLKDVFGDWDAVMKKHFVDGAIFDQITQK
jgi:sulfate transport system substrate-binding protein